MKFLTLFLVYHKAQLLGRLLFNIDKTDLLMEQYKSGSYNYAHVTTLFSFENVFWKPYQTRKQQQATSLIGLTTIISKEILPNVIYFYHLLTKIHWY